jgi:hypothetical protein
VARKSSAAASTASHQIFTKRFGTGTHGVIAQSGGDVNLATV